MTSPVTVIRRRRGECTTRIECQREERCIQEELLWAVSPGGLIENLKIGCLRLDAALLGNGVVTSTIQRRDDQENVYADFYEFMLERVLAIASDKAKISDFGRVILPPRTGKSVIMGEIVSGTGASALVLAPSLALVDQLCVEFQKQLPHVHVGKMTGEEKDYQPKGITVATYDTMVSLHRRGEISAEMRHSAFVFCDEGHEAMTQLRMDLLRNAFAPQTIRVAFTATPDYNPKRTMAPHFPVLIHEITLHEAMILGLFAEMRAWLTYVDSDASLVELVRKDYDEAQLSRLMSEAPFFETCRRFRYEEVDNARIPALICCSTRQQAHDLCSYLTQVRPEGSPEPAVVVGDTPRDERKRILYEFATGKLDTIINVAVLLRGWNSPRCKLLIDLAPSRSMVRTKQKWFRIMTKHEAKVARLYMILPQNLRAPPIYPTDFFGTSAKVSQVGELTAQRTPNKGVKPVEKRDYPAKRVEPSLYFGYENARVNPDLNPHVADQIRAVIEYATEMTHIPTYKAFRRKHFDHPLFTGPGAALLRYCGAYDKRGYLELMDRLYPEFSAARWVPLKERRVFKRETAVGLTWCSHDAEQLMDAINGGIEAGSYGHGGIPCGWYALAGDDERALTPEDIAIQNQNLEDLTTVMGHLTDRERYVLIRLYGLDDGIDRELHEVGADLNLSRERVRQIQSKGLRKLRFGFREMRSVLNRVFEEEHKKREDLDTKKWNLGTMEIWEMLYERRRDTYLEARETYLEAYHKDRDHCRKWSGWHITRVREFYSTDRWEDSGDYQRVMAMKPE